MGREEKSRSQSKPNHGKIATDRLKQEKKKMNVASPISELKLAPQEHVEPCLQSAGRHNDVFPFKWPPVRRWLQPPLGVSSS